jgi:hypothetical protein
MSFYIHKIKDNLVVSSNGKSFCLKKPSSNAITINPPLYNNQTKLLGKYFSISYPTGNASFSEIIEEVIDVDIGVDIGVGVDPEVVEIVEVKWLTRIEGTDGYVSIVNMQTDNNNGLYISGRTDETLEAYDASSTPDVALTTKYDMEMYSGAQYNYIVKYGADDGQVKWLTKIEGTDLETTPYNMQIDNNDDLYISGRTYDNPLTVYDASSTPEGILSTKYDMTRNGVGTYNYIVKYGADDGHVKWLTKIEGTDTNTPYIMQTDNNNGLYISGGSFTELELYDASSTPGNPSTKYVIEELSPTGLYIYIVKYGAEDGQVTWLTKIDGSGTLVNMKIYDSGLYISGRSNSQLKVYDASSTPNVALSTNYKNIPYVNQTYNYIVKYGAEDGQVKWLTKIGQLNGYTLPLDMQIDNNDGIYMSGQTTATTLKVNNSVLPYNSEIMSDSYYEMDGSGGVPYNYIVKYGQGDGEVKWLTKIEVDDSSYNMQTDNNNGLYISGGSLYELELYDASSTPGDPLSTNYVIEEESGYYNYIVKYGAEDGQVKWLTKIEGSTGFSVSYNMHIDNDGIYISGNSTAATLKVYDASSTPGDPLSTNYVIDGSSSGNQYNYIVKYGAEDGQVKWLIKIGRNSINQPPSNIYTDDIGDLCISGYNYDVTEINVYNPKSVVLGTYLTDTYQINEVSQYIIKCRAFDGALI